MKEEAQRVHRGVTEKFLSQHGVCWSLGGDRTFEVVLETRE